MAVIKVFDCNGVKTVQFLGNVNEQDYDPVPVVDIAESSDEDDDIVYF